MKKMLGTLTLAMACASSLGAADSTMVCEKTGTEVEACCCVEQADGGMICTLTGEKVDACCCTAK